MKIFNIILGFIITLLVILIFNFAKAEIIIGNAKIIDGDTIEINDERIRLACIDTPESNYRGKIQYCLDNETNCGFLAKQALYNFIDNKEVICKYDKRDIYGRILGFCQEYSDNNNYNYKKTYNYKLISEGYAWYYSGGKQCKLYKEIFKNTKKEKIGLFNETLGGFKEPKIWRKTKSN